MSNPFRNRSFTLFFLILVAFLVTRFLGAGQIYHQDEYRWAVIANPIFHNFTGPHPPLTKYLLRFVGELLGFGNLRYAILLFGLLDLVLVYKVVKKLTAQTGAALLGALLYTVSVYGAIANLQIDIDGATLPFFGLLTYYAYLHILEGKKKYWWGIFGLALAGGFLTKVSFVLFLAALIVDYIFVLSGSGRFNVKNVLMKVLKLGGGILLVGAAFYYLYAQRSSAIIQYAEHFKSLNFGSRAYFDLAFKVMKSLVWLSPLLALPPLAGLFMKDMLKRYRFWYLYLFFNLVFYMVLFDFTNLTIERYFMFMVVPTVIIGSEILHHWIKSTDLRKHARAILLMVLAFIGLSFLILAARHAALPLNPKSAYVSHIKSLDFNFLLPLTGGSGPVGFYFSATYILFAWLASAICVIGIMTAKRYRPYFILAFFILGFGYNILFLNEYLSGSIFGSVPGVARESVDYIQSNPDIKSVITYYDIGAYDLNVMGKYYSRFYTAPTRDYTKKLTDFRGHYMIVDFPGIDKTSQYWHLLERCPIAKEFSDKQIHSYIFDCRYIKS